MKNMETPAITTERLTLRPFTMDDVDDVHEYTSDTEWARYLVNIPPQPYTREDSEELVSLFSDPRKWNGILRIFAIVLEGRVIGEIVLNQREDDRPNDRVEIAYSLSRQHWNGGLMTEAARAIMDWAFQAYDINRVYAWSDAKNIGSWRVLEKLGMQREGMLRSHMKWNGTFRDRVYFGILRSEWKGGI